MVKIVFLGCTAFSEAILKSLLEHINCELQAIFSIPRKFKISYSEEEVINSNFADLSTYAEDLNIPFKLVNSENGMKLKDYSSIIEDLKPDVILVMGWYYMVPKSVRQIPRLGAWGIHASLLPSYAGGAPLVWAMINGEKVAGVSLFQLSGGVDDGDIIQQVSFPIEDTDTIKEVYGKATECSIHALTETFDDIENLKFTPQDTSKIEVWPQRSPADGEIDWSWDADRIRNFIRAQTHPYPGAWTEIDGKKIIIWDAHIIPKK
ncbi:methionyl-tRNA formyltransferase [Roseivirga sp. 4D4]|uniref:methionyl-tRNA formyltransferase n=1 Tax=Roseivirga sp. 4D4 TaxID=1889784 RepID=UPI00147D6247|nr:methionyl-tRNA formyltransferase [Roseivirga sp. 4D4]